MFLALSLAGSFLCGYLCYRIAESKGRQPRIWMIWGVLLAPFPLLLLLIVPSRQHPFSPQPQ
jgi:hypothetical protein